MTLRQLKPLLHFFVVRYRSQLRMGRRRCLYGDYRPSRSLSLAGSGSQPQLKAFRFYFCSCFVILSLHILKITVVFYALSLTKLYGYTRAVAWHACRCADSSGNSETTPLQLLFGS